MEKAKKKDFRTLYRSEENRVIGGVAGGLGEYFEIDPTIVRLIFVLVTVFGGSGLLVYLLLWIFIPSKSASGSWSEESVKKNVAEIRGKANEWAGEFKSVTSRSRGQHWLGWFIIGVGAIVLLKNFGLLRGDLFLALVLFGVGMALILKR